MKRFIQRLLYLIPLVPVFYLLPLISGNTGGHMLNLLILTPFACFMFSFLWGKKGGFDVWFPLALALIFVPTIFIYYNISAWVYILIFAGLSFIGNLLGFMFAKRRL